MDLFDYMKAAALEKEAPLAVRMRPKTLEDVVGQEHILAKDKLLYRAIKADRIRSIIFYGPPGTGKTTLAMVIAGTTRSGFLQMNATVAGKKDIMEVVDQAKHELSFSGRRTILFIDEIHRFNKAQQDALLPYVEDGTVILIGATTENPYFEVNKALVSRSQIFLLEKLKAPDIEKLLCRAVSEDARLAEQKVMLTDEAARFLAEMADGDARTALNALELGAMTTAADDHGRIIIDLAVAEECIQRRAIRYDKDGDEHYDIISAFIKSMRGSDADAAVYYLARMLYAGEDPKFIVRRVIICAAEDVGNADPRALEVAVAAARAVEFVGMPEARIILSQAVCYVAAAPKSNAAYLAVDQALQDVKNVTISSIPIYLKDAHYAGAKDLGHSGYLYAHDYPHHYVRQQYLPDELAGRRYYQPTQQGYERKISEWLEYLKKEEQQN
ncbi:replication-associated recombination protein RarA [Lachnospiraceae bacterium oral taxon 500]|nr:replication-associated recombination protein RarA [Lachnospiraceae bacterium oral taxon 500]